MLQIIVFILFYQALPEFGNTDLSENYGFLVETTQNIYKQYK